MPGICLPNKIIIKLKPLFRELLKYVDVHRSGNDIRKEVGLQKEIIKSVFLKLFFLHSPLKNSMSCANSCFQDAVFVAP